MGAAVRITREEHSSAALRGLASRCRHAGQSRRLLAIAMVLDGVSRLEAARQAGMDRQTLRDWVHRYNSDGVDGLVDRSAPGASPKLTEAQKAELRHLAIAGPDPETDQVVRWRCLDLREQVAQRFAVTVHERRSCPG